MLSLPRVFTLKRRSCSALFLSVFMAAFAAPAAAPAQTAPVYYEDFDKPMTPDELRAWAGLDAYIAQGCGIDGSSCMLIPYERCVKGTARMLGTIPVPPAAEYTLEYYIKPADNWDPVKGGKIHGLGPANYITGCADGAADRWSIRAMWRREGVIWNYAYDQNKSGECGADYGDETGALKPGVWQRITIYVKVNTPGVADGVTKVYLDGVQIASTETMLLRGNVAPDQALIERMIFSTFYGGNAPDWGPDEPTEIYYDNFSMTPGVTNPAVPVTGVNTDLTVTDESAFYIPPEIHGKGDLPECPWPQPKGAGAVTTPGGTTAATPPAPAVPVAATPQPLPETPGAPPTTTTTTPPQASPVTPAPPAPVPPAPVTPAPAVPVVPAPPSPDTCVCPKR